MNSGTELWVVLMLLVAIVAQSVSLAVQLRQSWRARRPRSTPWTVDVLRVEGGGWRVHDVRWRNEGGYVEVEYSIENHLPGQTWYRNDFIRVFQHGVGLEEEGGLVSRVLLKGAEIRFVQTFLARDGSTPVIQVDSSYASGEEDGA